MKVKIIKEQAVRMKDPSAEEAYRLPEDDIDELKAEVAQLKVEVAMLNKKWEMLADAIMDHRYADRPH